MTWMKPAIGGRATGINNSSSARKANAVLGDVKITLREERTAEVLAMGCGGYAWVDQFSDTMTYLDSEDVNMMLLYRAGRYLDNMEQGKGKRKKNQARPE